MHKNPGLHRKYKNEKKQAQKSFAKLHCAKCMILDMQIFTRFKSSLFTRKNLKILSFFLACILAFPCINLVMHNLFNSERGRETPKKKHIQAQKLAGKSAHQYVHLSGKPFYAKRYPFRLKKDAHLQ